MLAANLHRVHRNVESQKIIEEICRTGSDHTIVHITENTICQDQIPPIVTQIHSVACMWYIWKQQLEQKTDGKA